MKEPKFYRIFDYNKKLLPNKHLALLEEGVKTIDQARKISGASVGYPGWNLIYYLLLSHLDKNRDEGEDTRVYGALKDIKRKYGGNFINLEFVSWFTPGMVIWSKNK